MKNSTLLLLLTLIVTFSAFSQNRYIVFFKDKGDLNKSSYNNLLSEKTVEKRARQGISFDSFDLPVNRTYLNNLTNNNVKIISTSKWLNAAIIETQLQKTELLSINTPILKVIIINTNAIKTTPKFDIENYQALNTIPSRQASSQIDYGLAETQNLLFEIDYLHDQGFVGNGVTVAFLDVGFDGLDTLSYLSSTFSNNRVIDTYDYWDDSVYVYHKNGHGTAVSFKVLGNTPGDFVGMAPNINTMFYVTDDLYTETHQDEFYFVKALERADSIGVDIISASLVYRDFDGNEYDYTYQDMDGNTAISTLGCNIAAQKGIIVVASAGNGGKITAPADAFGILGVGGADQQKQYDAISSTGPSFDGRIKPDIGGLTKGVFTVRPAGNVWIGTYDGTSAAAPFISGLAACLVEAHPFRTNAEIIEAIKQSGTQANSPDSLIGYGVPNARIADSLLSLIDGVSELNNSNNKVSVYPNPSTGNIIINSDNELIEILIFSITGQLKNRYVDFSGTNLTIQIVEKGVYIIQVTDVNKNTVYDRVIIN